jgi:ABC-type amino acid transport substrate-binding protein
MWQQLLCLVLSSCSHTDTDVLRGREIHVTSFLSAPYLIRNPDAIDGYEGFMVDLLDALADNLGCRFIIREVADGRYGMKKEGSDGHSRKEEWTGMIGEVMRGEADLAVADLTATAARSLVVDFTQPILDNQLVAVANRGLATVTSLAELAERDNVTFLVMAGGSTSKFFQLTKDPVYRAVAEKMR